MTTATVRQDRECLGSRCCFRKDGQTGCPCYVALVHVAEVQAAKDAKADAAAALERDRVIAITHDADPEPVPVSENLDDLIAAWQAKESGGRKKKRAEVVQERLF